MPRKCISVSLWKAEHPESAQHICDMWKLSSEEAKTHSSFDQLKINNCLKKFLELDYILCVHINMLSLFPSFTFFFFLFSPQQLSNITFRKVSSENTSAILSLARVRDSTKAECGSDRFEYVYTSPSADAVKHRARSLTCRNASRASVHSVQAHVLLIYWSILWQAEEFAGMFMR